MLPQLGFRIPVLFTLVLFFTENVRGEIVMKCGSGAVVGQPYDLECTDIQQPVTNGINVYLEGQSNSIIFCFKPSQSCDTRNSSLYSVKSPHNESLYFTILSVTTDDIGKSLFCVDGNSPNGSPSKSSCQIPRFTTTTESTTTSMNDKDDGLTGGEIAGIVIGSVAFVVIIVVIVVVAVIYIKNK